MPADLEPIKTESHVRKAACPSDLATVDFLVTGVSGLQLRVARTGAKTWRVRTRATGSVILGRWPDMDLNEARKSAMRLLGETDRRKRLAEAGGAVVPTVDRRTLKDLLNSFETAKGARLRSWPEQRRAIEQRYATHLKKPALHLDAKAVRRPVEKERNVAAKRTAVYLSGVLRWAGVGQPVKQQELNDLVVETPRSRILTREELRAILGQNESVLADYLQILLRTAQRRGDVAAMRWADVDIQAGIWRFTMQKSRSRTPIELPLGDVVWDMLEQRKKVATSHFVFSTSAGTAISNFNRITTSARKMTGTEDWTLHDLRRTARTIMGRIGIRPDIAERCLGHTVVGTVERVYDLHRYQDEVRQAFNQLSKHLDALAAENVVLLSRPSAG